MQLYNRFVEFCESLLSKVTTQWLIYGALMLFSFFLVWIVFAAITSSVRKFYIRCDKLEWFLIHNKIGYDQINAVDPYCRKISRSFAHAWNKFKKSNGKKPSDFLTKREVLDSEVSDGLLNHGKTLMKTFIGVSTVLLFILNLALLGKDSAINFAILVKSLFLPFVYYVVMIIMYFISNLIRHQFYVIATAHFYVLVDELDESFAIKSEPEVFEEVQKEIISETEEPIANDEIFLDVQEPVEISDDNSQEIQDENIEEIEETQVQEESAIDLSAFEINSSNDVAETEESSDFQNEEFEEIENKEDDYQNAEELIQIDNEELKDRDWEAEENLDYYDVFKKKNINVDKYINEIPNEEEFNSPFINVDGGFVPNDEMAENIQVEDVDEEVVDIDENHPLNEFEKNEELIDVQQPDEDIYDFAEKHDDAIEEDLNDNQTEEVNDSETIEDDSVFNLNDLLADGEDDEESEYIDESFESDEVEENEKIEENIDENSSNEEVVDVSEVEDVDFFDENNEETTVDIFEDNNTFEEEVTKTESQQNELKSQIQQNLSDSSKEIDSKLEETIETNIDLSALVGEYKQNQNDEETDSEEAKEEIKNDENANNNDIAKDLYAKINDLEDLIHSAISKDEKAESKSKTTKTRKTRKGKAKMTTETEKVKKSRGRPKMQAIDENLIITSEEQFEEILSRAEKLMRKSESGLSQSQSKRIEKELKIMMDAMNKYKEGK